MTQKSPIGIEWTVVSTGPDGRVSGKSFGTEKEAREHAARLPELGHTGVSVVSSEIKIG